MSGILAASGAAKGNNSAGSNERGGFFGNSLRQIAGKIKDAQGRKKECADNQSSGNAAGISAQAGGLVADGVAQTAQAAQAAQSAVEGVTDRIQSAQATDINSEGVPDEISAREEQDNGRRGPWGGLKSGSNAAIAMFGDADSRQASLGKTQRNNNNNNK